MSSQRVFTKQRNVSGMAMQKKSRNRRRSRRRRVLGARSNQKPYTQKVNRRRRIGTQRVSLPVAVGTRSYGREPQMAYNSKAFTISHCEYFATVTADTAVVIDDILINPGNSTMFPWLSQIAPSWERYRFKYLAIEYVPSCSTTTSGDVAMFIDYDAEDPVAADFNEFAKNGNCVHTAMYVPVTLDSAVADMDRQNRGFYYTTNVAVGADDYEHYYPGRFEMFTSALGASTAIGKLWVHYQIDLFNPQGQAEAAAGYLKNTATSDILVGSNWFVETDNNYIYSKGFAWTSAGLTCMASGTYYVTFYNTQTSVLTISGCTNQKRLGQAGDKSMTLYGIEAVRGQVLTLTSDETLVATNWFTAYFGKSALTPVLTFEKKHVLIRESKFEPVDDDNDMMDERPKRVVSKSPLRK